MKSRSQSKPSSREQRWVLFSNGCVHGIRHSELVVLHKIPSRSMTRSTVSVFSVSRLFGLCAGVAVLVVVLLLLTACQMPRAQKGGGASTTIIRPGQTNTVTLKQSENPKERSRQTVQSEQRVEYVLPPGSAIQLGGSSGTHESTSPSSGACVATLQQPVPVRGMAKDRTETSIGGAQRDTAREWAVRAANMQPVMWAGLAMMTLVAGVLVYFGWWTKAAVAVAVGLGMIVLAQTLPDHGTLILLGGLGVFALIALLVLYAYYKGQLDKNHNGVPDVLEKKTGVPV